MNKFIIVFLLFTISIKAQEGDNIIPPRTEVFYWFSIKIDKSLDKSSGLNQLTIRNVGNEIKSGLFNEFMNNYTTELKSDKITIGPFSDQSQALIAQSIYRSPGKDSPYQSQDSDKDGKNPTFAFFYVNPITDDSTRETRFERIPSRVSYGTPNDFSAMLEEGLSFGKLAIGPFDGYEYAERSKFAFRKNDGQSIENKADSLRSKNMKMMAKKWKNIKVQLAKQPDEKGSKVYSYRFNTNFPGKYFASDAIQIIKITASYSESFETSSTCFTLQGDEVDDNNYVISSVSNTVYVNFLNFDKFSGEKIKAFFFESFIYNNDELIELEPIFVNIK